MFRGGCNHCGKEGHKRQDCEEYDDLLGDRLVLCLAFLLHAALVVVEPDCLSA